MIYPKNGPIFLYSRASFAARTSNAKAPIKSSVKKNTIKTYKSITTALIIVTI